MVDDIHFPKGLPPIPPSEGVQRVDRKKREEEKPPFEGFLEQEDKKKKKHAQESDSVDILSEIEVLPENNSAQSSGSTGSAEAEDDEDDIEKKIIDVRV